MTTTRPQFIRGNYYQVDTPEGTRYVPEQLCGVLPLILDNDPLREEELDDGLYELEKFVPNPTNYTKFRGWMVGTIKHGLRDETVWQAYRLKQAAVARMKELEPTWELAEAISSIGGRPESTKPPLQASSRRAREMPRLAR